MNFDLVGFGKNMGNLILAIKNVFSLNKKFDSGLFFLFQYCISMTPTNDSQRCQFLNVNLWNSLDFPVKMISWKMSLKCHKLLERSD